MSTPEVVSIRPYAADDFALLERLLGDPVMMEHLGGPESAEALAVRHARYLAADPETNGLFAIVVGPRAQAAGWVGYWETDWRDRRIWECGWHVLPEHQGRGIATAGCALAIDHARIRGRNDEMHAFPSVDNAASNALCRALGFTLLGAVDIEYPPGRPMRSNDWRLDLPGAESSRR